MFISHTRKTLSNFNKSSLYFSLHFSTSTDKPNSTVVSVSEFLIHKHEISPHVASRVAYALTHVENPESLDSVISFLRGNGFSKPQLEKAMKMRPQVLLSSVDRTLKPKVKFLKEFGFSNADIAVIISNDPWFIARSLSKTIEPGLSVLKSVLGSNAKVAKTMMTPGLFNSTRFEKSLVLNVEYLSSCGVQMDQIRRFFYYDPRLFLCKHEVMKQLVDRAERIGADRGSRMFLHSVRVVKSMSEETLESKFQGFRDLGFSEDDILGIFRKNPQLLAMSLEKPKRVAEVLLGTGKYTMESIISFPKALSNSVDKRYTPRINILGVLERKNLIKQWPSLSSLSLMTDEKFFKTYVAPHLNELSEVLPKAGIR